MNKVVQKLRFNRDSCVMAKFGENRPLRSCRKVISYCWQKKPGVGDTFEPLSISPHLGPNRFRPKFHERCRPLTCARVPTLVRIGCDLPDLFRKAYKKWIQYRLSAYNKIVLLPGSSWAEASISYLVFKADKASLKTTLIIFRRCIYLKSRFPATIYNQKLAFFLAA